jgi:hypothetical protein
MAATTEIKTPFQLNSLIIARNTQMLFAASLCKEIMPK